jgi:hypothetical protein
MVLYIRTFTTLVRILSTICSKFVQITLSLEMVEYHVHVLVLVHWEKYVAQYSELNCQKTVKHDI